MSAPENPGEWIAWEGGECPVADGAMIQVQFRCESRESAANDAPERARGFYWTHEGHEVDIIAYRIVSSEASGRG